MDIDLKPPFTYDAQVQLLKQRNLIIENEGYAKRFLSRVNYYRFSAYSLGLRENDVFKENVTFEQICRLYDFDVSFKYLLLETIEIIEVMLRTKIAYHMAMKYGSESYLNEKFFRKKEYHVKFVNEFMDEKKRQKDNIFIKHHNEKYGGRMPIWVATEIFSFGMLSRFYSNMEIEDQKEVAREFNTRPDYLRSWLKCLVDVRNICAHYGRVYNRPLASSPKLYSEYSKIKCDRIFAILIVIRRLLDIHDENNWRNFLTDLSALVEKYKDVINFTYIGFPDDWENLLGEYIKASNSPRK